MKTLGRILVVEDSPPNRMILCHLLQKMGFEVFESGDGEEALQWLSENTVDTIITDLMMPKVDGLQLLKTLREQDSYKNLPIFIVTALGEQESIQEAHNLKCNGLLHKPISVSELRENLQKIFPGIKLEKKVG